MKRRWAIEIDGWGPEGRKINSEDNLNTIRHVLEEVGPIILEHWFYKGASAPDRLVFDDYDNFLEYLNTKTWAGDMLYVWSFSDVCKDDNSIVWGKCPDDDGMVPRRGAY